MYDASKNIGTLERIIGTLERANPECRIATAKELAPILETIAKGLEPWTGNASMSSAWSHVRHALHDLRFMIEQDTGSLGQK